MYKIDDINVKNETSVIVKMFDDQGRVTKVLYADDAVHTYEYRGDSVFFRDSKSGLETAYIIIEGMLVKYSENTGYYFETIKRSGKYVKDIDYGKGFEVTETYDLEGKIQHRINKETGKESRFEYHDNGTLKRETRIDPNGEIYFNRVCILNYDKEGKPLG